jgi:hypothetical protein
MPYPQEARSTNKPTQEQIEAGLRSFQPHPGERFYRRMATSPWAQTSYSTKKGVSFMKNIITKPLSPRALAISMLTTLTLAFGILATPWGQALAGDVLGFFIHKNDDVLAISAEEASRAGSHPIEIEQPTHQYASAPLALESATAKLGFDVKEPDVIPDGFGFRGATAANKGVSLTYEFSGGGHGRTLIIDQKLMTDSDSTAKVVGASATIEEVQIGEVKGEYVEGDFVILPGATTATWNSDAPIRRLRWVNNGVLFQMTASGGSEDDYSYIGKAELIAIAESLK